MLEKLFVCGLLEFFNIFFRMYGVYCFYSLSTSANEMPLTVSSRALSFSENAQGRGSRHGGCCATPLQREAA